MKYDHLQPRKNLCTCLVSGRGEGRQLSGRLGSALFVQKIIGSRTVK